MHDESLIYVGDAVKALGDGRVGGYLVRFGTADTPDIQGEYFTPQTDFGLDVATKARVVYHHGMSRRADPFSAKFRNRRIGIVDIKAIDDGLWAEGQLDVSDPDIASLYTAVEADRVGWSSGSVDRLVRKQAVKSALEIQSWPIIEASLSFAPVDRRNRAVAIKAMMDDEDGATEPTTTPPSDTKGEHLGDYAGSAAMRSALDTLHAHAAGRMMSHMEDTSKPRDSRMAACAGCLDEYRAKGNALVAALMDENTEAVKALIERPDASLSLVDTLMQLDADAQRALGLASKAVQQRSDAGRTFPESKRAAIKAASESLAVLWERTALKPKVDRRALVLRMLAERI